MIDRRMRPQDEVGDLESTRRSSPRTMGGLDRQLRRADALLRMAEEMVSDIEGCCVGSDVDDLVEPAELMSLMAQALARELIEMASPLKTYHG